MDIPEHILNKLDIGLCWVWTASTTRGYGTVWLGGLQIPAHRAVWLVLVGPIPRGLQLDHLCGNTLCANPDHLEPVTQQENLRRQANPRVLFTDRACPKGHTDVTMRGGRARCKSCRRERYAARR